MILPEQLALQIIVRQLSECGSMVQERRDVNIMAGLGVFVREVTFSDAEVGYVVLVAERAAKTITTSLPYSMSG